jgi:hypothetical protein
VYIGIPSPTYQNVISRLYRGILVSHFFAYALATVSVQRTMSFKIQNLYF